MCALSCGCLLANVLWNCRQVEAEIQDYIAVGLPEWIMIAFTILKRAVCSTMQGHAQHYHSTVTQSLQNGQDIFIFFSQSQMKRKKSCPRS